MIENILFYIHYALLLLFGIILTFAFAGLRFSRKNAVMTAVLAAACGLAQLLIYIGPGEDMVWKVYPLITHLPAVLVLCIYCRKKISTALASVSATYLCCQLPKWMGMLAAAITGSPVADQAVRIVTLLAVGFAAVRFFAGHVSEIFSKDTGSVLIFSCIPMIYYLFDYSMSIYTDIWLTNNRVAAEFMPFFLCIIYFLFCTIYYREYEQKAEALRKEQITAIAVQQQQSEMAAIRRSEHEIRILRHDMKHFLDMLAVHLQENDVESSLKIVESLSSKVADTAIRRFCTNDMINYVLSNYTEKCSALMIRLDADIAMTSLHADEIMFCSILSNALDNAVNAVRDLPPERRHISLMLKTSSGRLLLSVKNPFRSRPVFRDGMPVSASEGKEHGYGTQSIRYMTEKLGGNCQFTLQDEYFILRIVI